MYRSFDIIISPPIYSHISGADTKIKSRRSSLSSIMVSSLLVDTLNDPTRALRDIYDPCEQINKFPITVSSYFSKVFESADAFKEV